MKKYVYFFGDGKAEGSARLRDLLGGKGAGLAEMTNAGLPVPPGFTITTEACRVYYERGGNLTDEIEHQMREALQRLEQLRGERLGDSERPLLVSVRSGAKFSMPGMMDTILNLGLNDETVEALARRTSDRRFAFDCYRRFIQMFGNVVMGIDKQAFEHLLQNQKEKRGAIQDVDLSADDLHELTIAFKKLVEERTGRPFPQDPYIQLKEARDAVFRSWNNERAVTYRQIHHIPHDLGTAVTVQAMVFGNMGERSGSGVGFTRNPATGEKALFGEFLFNAQGEDVVAGIRTPLPLSELKTRMPDVYDQLQEIAERLERHYHDMQDFEFTVQEGQLFMLQTRSGKRTGYAAVRIACEFIEEGLVSEEEALRLIEAQSLNQLLHPAFERSARVSAKVIGRGLPSSPGAAAGRIALTANQALRFRRDGFPVILVRTETSPDDIAGMQAAEGFLTARGGATSHAAVVGRQMGKPAVVGCADLVVDETNRVIRLKETLLHEGDVISLDGTTGEVLLGEIRKSDSEILQVIRGQLDPASSPLYQYFNRIMTISKRVKKLGVRANADTPEDARLARALGAEGIGLCRTEHMFFGPDRLPWMQSMILATTPAQRREALQHLLPMQRSDFAAIFREMDGLPVTIRLLDPPLHEFLPRREQLLSDIASARSKGETTVVSHLERILSRVEELHEFNPMLGLRGCRLGILYPEVTEMQARAIFEAACQVTKEGAHPIVEIMVPLVSTAGELQRQREIIQRVAHDVFAEQGITLPYLVGTMIELPRASLLADEIARSAEFFSFGTNDLTQTTFGLSRDDTTAVIEHYLKIGILESDPFSTLDSKGVGELIKIGVERGRRTRADLKTGICGEHGGDPKSIELCHHIGLDYVSCSPYRIPIAILAAAQASVTELAAVVE
ncbi:MAG TPA: pyruvate, phosphate dikinase [Blastocatellia bacterium]|nr:pyruvate, phosphate dikinase [Blastocatellia bacterium]